jgi:hypothetical protein
MDYTKEDLEKFIEEAELAGNDRMAQYYMGHLDRLNNEESDE